MGELCFDLFVRLDLVLDEASTAVSDVFDEYPTSTMEVVRRSTCAVMALLIVDPLIR